MPVLDPNHDGSFGLTDDDFQAWMLEQLVHEAPPDLCQSYASVFEESAQCIRNWRVRFRGNPLIWKRLFKRDRVVKEVLEAIPIIDAVHQWTQTHHNETVTIVDLCSGKGYLSMILSEYLASKDAQVQKLVLVDKAWPMCHATPQPHHMNWDHIYGNATTAQGNISYFTTWPIPLYTSKQNIKNPSSLRSLSKRLTGPVLLLGVHLCGTLSIQAVHLFQQLLEAKLLILKPCCLPGIEHITRDQKEFLDVGHVYRIPTREVCAPGKFRQGDWEGPIPRWQLQGKFGKWCQHLYQALQACDHVHMHRLEEIPIQKKGFQNTFLFAEK